MSWSKFDDDCAGCRPIIFDPVTLHALSPNSKPMRAIMKCWSNTTLQQRQAWHRFTCQNSRAALDLIVIKELGEQFKKELEEKP